MHKVVIDTNVILSGVLFGGTPALLLDAIQKQKFIFCTSQKNHDEVLDKLTHKFLVDDELRDDVVRLFSYGVFYAPTTKVNFPHDPEDAYLLELVETCNADYFITSDQKHLIPLKIWKATKIITPNQAKSLFINNM